MADVDTLDAQRRVGQAERILNALQCSRSRGEVARTLEFVLRQRIQRIAPHSLGERAFVSALRHPQRHVRAAQL